MLGIGVAKDVEAFSVRLHQSILDAVVDHLHKVARARWAAVEIAIFDRAGDLLPAGSASDIAATRSERFENRIEMTRGFLRSANHHAVAAFESPHTAARTHIHIVDAFVF